MSVRRLAAEEVQPASFAFSNDNVKWVKTQLSKFPEGRQASAVIPLLWQAQKQAGGWLPRAAIEHVGDVLGMPYIRVLEVATFYTMFNLEPVGKYFIQLCGTTPCALRGAERIKDVCRERIGEQNHVTADGKFSWLEVECLGACCNAPMVQINDDFYEDLTPETFNKLLDDLAAGRPVKIGPQNGRLSSEPDGAVKTLLSADLYDGSAVGSWRKAFDERFEKAAAAKAAAAQAAAAPKPAAPAPAPAAPAPVAGPAATAAAPARPTAGTGAPSNAVTDTPAAAGAAVAAKGAATAPASAAAQPTSDQATKAPIVKVARPEDKPPTLAAARPGGPDDLELIWGVGPKLAAMLNRMGVFHFDQIAAWTDRQLVWVDENLEGFYGRARRDDWIGQSKKLATGWRPENAVGDKPDAKK
jgi:NADH-quinone oxidoreductase subunit E